MLKDADPEYFVEIYIVCGYTNLRYGIDSLAAIIERRYHMDLFVPNTLFLFCGRSSTNIKGLLWEGDGFLLLYKRVECGHFSWPRNCNKLHSITLRQFKWLMQGFAIKFGIKISSLSRHSNESSLSHWFKHIRFIKIYPKKCLN